MALTVKKQLTRRFRQIASSFSAERQLIIVASAHKVGSTWLCNLISDLCDCPGYKLSSNIRQANRGTLAVDIDLDTIIASAEVPRRTFVLKSHSYPPDNLLPTWAKLITMTRDPRDVIVSSAFYLANLAEGSGGWGERFAALPVKERIGEIIRNGEFLRSRLRAWNKVQDAHHVRYESLLEDPAIELGKIQKVLNNRKSADQVAKIIYERSFANESGRMKGIEDKESFLRKGVQGDWRNYFDEELKNVFKSELNGDWSALVLELGYESDNSW